MGARGPKPSGSVKLSARLSAGLVKALMASAAKRKKNMSQEIENRLSQALREDSDDRTRGLVLLPTSVLRSTMGRKPMPARIEDLKAPAPAPSTNAPHWLDDRAAFDQAVIAINTVLAAIRPPGEAPTDDLPFRGRFNALATLQDLVKAPVMAPASASKHVRSMVHIRDAIGGDVVDRALTFGRTAEQIRDSEPDRLELAALRRKHAASKLKPPGPPLTDSETRRMLALAKRLATIPAEGEPMVFDEFKRDPE